MSSIINKTQRKKVIVMDKNNINKQEIHAAQRAYYKEWRAKNKGKVKQYNQNYWSKKAQKNRAAENSPEE